MASSSTGTSGDAQGSSSGASGTSGVIESDGITMNDGHKLVQPSATAFVRTRLSSVPPTSNTVRFFLRSCSILSCHFPINAAGEPYVLNPLLLILMSISILSFPLLTLPPVSLHPSAPFEHISLVDSSRPPPTFLLKPLSTHIFFILPSPRSTLI
ncbi:hypothetical protein C8R41DRAFT_978860 [Lentinula lateritia]|uniref:Uncharacterized protein n=1 Tax=Lentinula lateritia TaxID=40482 RepID=A0ABQ8VR89_9AGAR|nr:hypothetical protein C8R41DRAFT_978860 [Lentinula lateritia]